MTSTRLVLLNSECASEIVLTLPIYILRCFSSRNMQQFPSLAAKNNIQATRLSSDPPCLFLNLF
jgi:hypothetical protein